MEAKLQTIPLKFGSVWILHLKILEFGFYLLKFGGIWILHPKVSKIGFYPLKFGSVWISPPKVWESQATSGCKIQTALNFKE